MSDGIRSGVNWMRPAVRPSTVPMASTSFVLARPGTPTSRPWPPEKHGGERPLQHDLLAEDHFGKRLARLAQFRRRALGLLHDRFGIEGGGIHCGHGSASVTGVRVR